MRRWPLALAALIGTLAGVGNSTGTYLKPGDKLEAGIASIGTLVSPVAAE